jgi:FkbM family methyltransferase
MRQIELNAMKNVTVVPDALSDSEGEGTIYVTSATAKMLSPSPWESATSVVSLHRTTLDRFCDEYSVARIDFMKVDIDGHEGAFLDGAQQALSRYRPTLLIEISPKDNPKGVPGVTELCRRLAAIGYWFCSEDTHHRFADAESAVSAVLAKSPNGGNLVCMPAHQEAAVLPSCH